MEKIYVENPKNVLECFVCAIGDDDDNCHFKGVKEIAAGAFCTSEGVKQFFFDDSLTAVKKNAFKNCEELKLFCCGDVKKSKNIEELKGVELYKTKQFSIETTAFSGCEELNAVVLPKCGELIIEKNAFEGCSSLRAVVALAEKIKITENPFKDCPKDSLTFVCYKNSDVERFARENGYRYVNVQQK